MAGDMGSASDFTGDASAIIDLWNSDELAYGVFVPSADGFTVELAEELGGNEYLDFLFLDLEANPYDITAVHNFVEGLSRIDAADRPTLLVRLPTIETAGYDLNRQQTEEVLAAGADGLVYPHIMSVEMATRVKTVWDNLKADVWTPDNPDGTIATMIMVEDREALENVAAIADVGGYSLLSCGIGSLSGNLGSPEAGEAGCLQILAQANRVGVPSVQLAFDTEVLQRRIDQGYTGILMQMNENMPNIVRAGWAATGRQ
jgi:2-keto-3-deoxy-L-rhamnonate aldolase RhmA